MTRTNTMDLSRFLVATLRADAQLKALMGATSADPRVYPYYEPSAIIDPSQGKRGYVTIAHTAFPERTSAVGNKVWSLALWADSHDTAQAMSARILALLDCSGDTERTVTAPGGVVYQPICIGEHWSSQENTKFFGINLQFRFGFSFV
jgi:hypothetical protein